MFYVFSKKGRRMRGEKWWSKGDAVGEGEKEIRQKRKEETRGGWDFIEAVVATRLELFSRRCRGRRRGNTRRTRTTWGRGVARGERGGSDAGRAVATSGVRWSRLKRSDAARAQQLPALPLPPPFFLLHFLSFFFSLSLSFSVSSVNALFMFLLFSHTSIFFSSSCSLPYFSNLFILANYTVSRIFSISFFHDLLFPLDRRRRCCRRRSAASSRHARPSRFGPRRRVSRFKLTRQCASTMSESERKRDRSDAHLRGGVSARVRDSRMTSASAVTAVAEIDNRFFRWWWWWWWFRCSLYCAICSLKF